MLFHPLKVPTELKIIHLNKKQEQRKAQFLEVLNDKAALKKLRKQLAKTAKNHLKDNLKGKNKTQSKVFVLDFNGDVRATTGHQLREEISTIISIATQGDEVVVRLESGGGIVHAYGLAASQLIRLKDAGLKLTVCVDKISASGGYMMACVADKIISAPFAVVGSIGVVAQMPNFHKFLKNHDIDYEMFTAGDFKRTVTVFGENSDEDRAKFTEELEQTHVLFKDFVSQFRPKLDLAKIATGEHWYGKDALDLGLVDELTTSDSYLLSLMEKHQVYAISTQKKPTIAEKLGLAQAAESAVSMAVEKLPDIITKVEQSHRLK